MNQRHAPQVSLSDRPGVLRMANEAAGPTMPLRAQVQRHRPLMRIAGLFALTWCMIRIGVMPHPLDMADYLYLHMYEGNAGLLAQHVLGYVGVAALCLRWVGQYLGGAITEAE